MVSQHLVGVALQQLVSGAVSVAKFSVSAGEPAGNAAAGVLAPALKFLQSRFTDQSSRLTTAIEGATDRSWRALELVLAGDSLWDRLKSAMSPADMKAFRHDVRGLLSAANIDGNYPVDRRAASQELRAARKAGLLQPTGLTPAGMVKSLGVFARFDNPAELATAQWQATGAVASDLTAHGYSALASVVAFQPGGASLPLLGVAIRYFFRRAVEQDAELSRALTFAKLEGLAEAQQNQFESLNRLVTEQADRLDEVLGELVAEVAEVKAVALDIRAEQDKLGDQNRQIMEAILTLQGKLDQVGRPSVRPQDSISVRTDGERELVKKVIVQYRRLPEADRAGRPALRNAVGMLEVAAGEFAAAQSDFAAVAESVDDPAAKGAAHLNAYRAALEARDWTSALRELVAAVRCDGRKYAPFPVGKYVPQRILGAGGFGVAFLCKHKYMDAQVVVKTLTGGFDQDFEAVFAEARAAAGIQHVGIVRVTDCGYADPNTKDRPFVVMDYFPGQALDEHVRTKGTIPAEQLLPLARSLAEALGAAHAKGILHRDVKPGNILVQPNGQEFDSRVIDFGLAIRHKAISAEASTSRASKTLTGESIAGTVDYAAPEQMGRGNGAKLGPYSDVYGWAKTCCFALFQTPQPTLRHWKEIPAKFADLLGRCLEEDPKARPQSFAKVIAELDKLGSPAPAIAAFDVVEPRPARRKDEDDAPPVRKKRHNWDDDGDPERPRPKRKNREQSGGLPAWAGGLIAAGVVLLVGIIAFAARKKSTDTPLVAEQGNPQPPGQVVVPVIRTPRPQPQPKPEFTWPGGDPAPRPDLPTGWKETKPQGGAFSNTEYREIRGDGSILIGFEIGLGKVFNTDIIAYMRSIWQTPTGEQFGYAYGKKPAAMWTVKAKEGYALGGAVTAGGGALEGICFTFMKKDGAKTLTPSDWYVSEWYGEQSRKPAQDRMRAGDGSLLVGIHGKKFEDKGGDKYDDSGAIGSIGFVVVPSGVNPIQPSATVGGSGTQPKAGNRSTRIQGGGNDPEFKDDAPSGGLLVGVEVGVGRFINNPVVKSIRPVFRTNDKDTFGTWHGPTTNDIVKETVRAIAKPGYAIGSMRIKNGLGIDGLSVTFLKVLPNGQLDAKDSYESEWIGGQGGGGPVKVGDGTPTSGLIGRARPEGLTGLGLIYQE